MVGHPETGRIPTFQNHSNPRAMSDWMKRVSWTSSSRCPTLDTDCLCETWKHVARAGGNTKQLPPGYRLKGGYDFDGFFAEGRGVPPWRLSLATRNLYRTGSLNPSGR